MDQDYQEYLDYSGWAEQEELPSNVSEEWEEYVVEQLRLDCEMELTETIVVSL